jgi:hypothetical protein
MFSEQAFRAKKGLFYAIILLILFVAALVFTIIAVLNLQSTLTKSGELGQRALDIYRIALNSEEERLARDEAAKLAGTKAIYALAKQGGFMSKERSCGYAASIPLVFSFWNAPDGTACIPAGADLNLAFTVLFSMQWKQFAGPAANAQVQATLSGGKLFAVSAQPIWTIPPAVQYPRMEYATPWEFSTPIGFDTGVFVKLRTFAEHILGTCRLAQFEQKVACARAAIDTQGLDPERTALIPYAKSDKQLNIPEDVIGFVVTQDPLLFHTNPLALEFALFVPSS